MEAERKKNVKERKDFENEKALLRSGHYCGTESHQLDRSSEEVEANDGSEDL